MLRKIIFLTGLSILFGALASIATMLFIQSIHFINDWLQLLLSSDNQTVFILSALLFPTLGGLAVGLICYFFQSGNTQTLPDIIIDVQTLQFKRTAKGGVVHALCSIISIGCGASVGLYAPVAQLASNLNYFINNLFRANNFTNVTAIGCGVAAAIATAFDAPIAGLIFVHEVILRHYSIRTFAPVTLATVTGYILSNYIFKLTPLFVIDASIVLHSHEYFFLIVLGIVSAYVVSALVRLLTYVSSLAESWTIANYFKPAVAGLLLGISAIWLPDILGLEENTIRQVISDNGYQINDLAIIFVAKLVFTAVCLGLGFVGGIFSPVLVIGAMLGALMGELFAFISPQYDYFITVYIICGMMAVVSPIIGAPLTAIILVFELTRHYDLTIAAMVAVVFSNIVGYRLIGRSLYDLQLRRKGFDLRFGREKVVMQSQSIENCISDNYLVVTPEDSLSSIELQMDAKQVTIAYVVSSNGALIGCVSLLLLRKIRSSISADSTCQQYIQPVEIVLSKKFDLWSAMEATQKFTGESIPVIDKEENKVLIGVIHEAALLESYMNLQKQIRTEEHGG